MHKTRRGPKLRKILVAPLYSKWTKVMKPPTKKSQVIEGFKDFCGATSLHGYGYLYHTNSLLLRLAWILVIMVMTGVGIGFLIDNTNQYLESRIVTTIESSTAPLDDVVFPSVTICNLNQIESSFLRKMNITGDLDKLDLILKEFIKGHEGNLTEEEQKVVEGIQDYIGDIGPWYSFYDVAMQPCNAMYLSMAFDGKKLDWNDLPQWESDWDLGPYRMGTDHGACCYLAPHLNFEPTNWNLSYVEMYHELKAPAKNGKAYGFDVLLNAEQFNYAYHEASSAGFKIALHDHRDKPMMEYLGQMIHSGTETLINFKPSVSYTTKAAIDTFKPEDRGCFSDFEANLTYLYYEWGYRYEMNNCLIDEINRDIIWNCRCYARYLTVEPVLDTFIDACVGKKLHCAHFREKTFQQRRQGYDVEDLRDPDAIINPDMIGNVSKPDSIKCLPACQVQQNENQMSLAPYPQRENFFFQKYFCNVASFVWQRSCLDEDRKYFIDMKFPNLCETLQDFQTFFDANSTCEGWPKQFLELYEKPNSTLEDEMYIYGKDNLALIHILIQSPYITKIKRDVAMTFTSYIANTGGLLGLCLGFSFISAIELLYWFCYCFRPTAKVSIQDQSPKYVKAFENK